MHLNNFFTFYSINVMCMAVDNYSSLLNSSSDDIEFKFPMYSKNISSQKGHTDIDTDSHYIQTDD